MTQPPAPRVRPKNNYPTRDGRPIGETELHRDLLMLLLGQLGRRYETDPNVYVSGNLLVYHEEGNKRRRVSPDVFVVFGVPKGDRDNYLMWEEGKGPDVVIELTSKKTRTEDTRTKHDLYLNALGVREYFIFDPRQEYLSPSLQGFRRVKGEFRPIRPKAGRLPSKVLGLHLEREGTTLRLWEPVGSWLPTPAEELEALRTSRLALVAETERLRRETDQLRRETKALRRESRRLM